MAQLVPYSKFKAVDDDGVALVGGRLFSYIPATAAPKATYSDFGLSSSNANPIILDALGEATIYIDGNTDFILQNADLSARWGPIRAVDPTKDTTLENATLSGILEVSAFAVTWSGNPVHSGNHTWSGAQTFNANVTIGDNAADTLTIRPSAVTWANNPTHSGNHTFSGNVAVTGTLTGGYTWTIFTPTILFTVSAVGVTYSIDRFAQYCVVGDICFFHIRMGLSSKGSSTGPVYISNLPVAPSLANGSPVCSVEGLGLTGLTGALGGQILTDSIAITQSTATGNASITDANVTNTSEIYLSGNYPVA